LIRNILIKRIGLWLGLFFVVEIHLTLTLSLLRRGDEMQKKALLLTKEKVAEGRMRWILICVWVRPSLLTKVLLYVSL
jgi:hypothetical protein